MPYDHGDCRGYALDGRTALVTWRPDVVDLPQRLERLVTDPGWRARIAGKGRPSSAGSLTWTLL